MGNFVSELLDTKHDVRTFHLASGGKLTVTDGHPIVDGNGYMREASYFKVGDSFVRTDGHADRIQRIDNKQYNGKVYNILPFTQSLLGNIVVAEGYLNGSAYYQNDGVGYLNQKLLRKTLTNGVTK